MEVAGVRRFNRTVTQRVGALQDTYLSRGRPLGQARVLWEIGADGAEVRALRARLDLDSGYLSRILRALEGDGLIAVGADGPDGRVRTARLTPAGRAEVAELDRGADALAASILAPLNAVQRERLVAAMMEVERLLTASMVDIAVVDPGHRAVRHCVSAYFAELDARFRADAGCPGDAGCPADAGLTVDAGLAGDADRPADGARGRRHSRPAGFDPARSLTANDDELTLPAGLMLVATLHGEPVGCGALKLHGTGPAEIKRMWVAPGARGLGLGRRLLAELESHAAARGASAVRLETNRALVEAIALYQATGYREVAPFDDEPYADHWFEKP